MIRIECTNWQSNQEKLSHIRRKVFIEEQQVPEELEWDKEDADAIHLLAWYEDEPIATLRMLADGHIGRMAVLPNYRQRGIGRSLMQAIMAIARNEGLVEVHLDAQIQAIPFYLRLGFAVEGEVFMDAGIPHRHMRKRLLEE